MKRISVREGNLPEKVKHIAINPGVLNSNAGPPEVWECRDPGELMDYVKNKEAATHTMRPFKSGDKEDDHWYVVALILEETSDAGIVIPTNKLLFSIATPSWLRQEARKVEDEVVHQRQERWKPENNKGPLG